MVRASERRQRRISVPAGQAWAVITRPELLHLWFPGVETCRLEGTTRSVTLASGLALQEVVLTNDSLQRRFQYRISGGLFRDHLASIDVFELGEHECLVSYAADVDPAAMAIILGGAMTAALTELARQLEAGAGPVLDALVALAGDPDEAGEVTAAAAEGVAAGKEP